MTKANQTLKTKKLEGAVSIDNMELKDLLEQQDKISKAIQGKQTNNIKNLFTTVTEFLEENNIPLQKFLEIGGQEYRKTHRRKLPKLFEGAKIEGFTTGTRPAKNPVEPIYRNPNNKQEEWAGRGKTPRWMQTLLNKGHKREEFLIESKS